MQYFDVISKTNNLSKDDEVSMYFRAFKQDPVIWEGFKDYCRKQNASDSQNQKTRSLNPGSLALWAVHPDLEYTNSERINLSPDQLERIMFQYEMYIQSSENVRTFPEAASLAVGLVEKRRVADGWSSIFTEILNRMKISTVQVFELLWKSVLAITFNLISDREGFLSDLLNLQQPELGLGIFLHCVLCLPVGDDQKESLIKRNLFAQKPDLQAAALRTLSETSSRDLVKNIAIHLMEKYTSLDLDSKSSEEYWNNVDTAIRYAMSCQHIAVIAEYAENPQISLQLTNKSLEIFSAVTSISKIQKTSLLSRVAGAGGDEIAPVVFETNSIVSPEITRELVYTGVTENLVIEPENPVYPLKVAMQSLKMSKVGNQDIGCEQLRNSLKDLSEVQLEELMVKGPRFASSWDPAELLDPLLSAGAYPEVEKIAKILLKKSPSSILVNLMAAQAFDAQQKHEEAENAWENLSALDPSSVDIRRSLARAYVASGKLDQAYESTNRLIKIQSKAKNEDLISLAEIAIGTGKTIEALEVSKKILEENPEHPEALTLTGIALHETGKDEEAVEILKKATDLSGNDPRPWIALSDIYWRNGEKELAIKSLSEGRVANPGHQKMEIAYAERLMESGRNAEAYPILKELSEESKNEKIDTLLVRAMKELAVGDLNEVLERAVDRFPQNYELAGEYGQNLVATGKTTKGLGILKELKKKNELRANPALAYVDALLDTNYRDLVSPRRMTRAEIVDALKMTEQLLENQPANRHAGLLYAELMQNAGYQDKAFTLFKEALEGPIPDSTPVERIQAGLAISAAALGKFEIALAALQEAIERQPDWVGLQRIKAEILKGIGNIKDTTAQARQALEMAPDLVENVIWFTNFIRDLGNKKEIIEIVTDALIKNPKSIKLHLLAADVYSDQDEKKKHMGEIKTLLNETDNLNDLVQAAGEFRKIDDRESVIAFLTKAASTDPVQGKLNLAGFYRELGDLGKTYDVLSSIEDNEPLVRLLKAEVCHTQGSRELALELLSSVGEVETDNLVMDAFLPLKWRQVLESSDPVLKLRSLLAMTEGNTTLALETASNWLAKCPEDLDARIIAIESSLASGNFDTYNRLIKIDLEETISDVGMHLALLKAEYLLDQNSFADADRIISSVFQQPGEPNPIKLTESRVLASFGNTVEAEILFEQFKKANSIEKNPDPIFNLGVNRNLLKAAISLNRWPEAIEMLEKLIKDVDVNSAINRLAFECFVRALEFRNLADGLDVDIHMPWKNFSNSEINERFANLAQKQTADVADKWRLRGKLALSPTQENIRALALITPQPEDAAAMMSGLRSAGQCKTAIQVSKKFEEEPCVMAELARCLESIDPPQAIEVIKKSLEKNPYQPLMYRLLSGLFEQSEKFESAIHAMEDALEMWSNETAWHVRVAEISTRLGNLDKPVVHLEKAKSLKPDDIEILLKLGKALVLKGDPMNAIEYLTKAVELDPARADIWEVLSDANIASGNQDLAIEAAERAGKLDPSAVRPHLQAGKANWNKGELEKALDQVKLAISLDPEDSDSLVFAARLYKETGDKGKALETLEAASKCKNANVQTMIEHAKLMKEINGIAAARELLEVISARYPENPELLQMLAEAQEENGDLKRAEVTAKKVLDMDPDGSEIHIFLGKIQEKKGNLDQAAHYFSQAIVHDPHEIEGYLSLSNAFSKQREFGKARATLEEGMRNTSDDIRLYIACACLLKEGKDYNGAERILRKAAMIDPRNISVHRQLGAVLALNLVHQSQEVSAHL